MGKNKTIQRLTAMMLPVIMIVGMMPVSVAAETGGVPIGAGGDIVAFEALGADIAEQSVSVGTPQTDLKLPDTLRATVRLVASEEETALNSSETDSELDSTNPLEGLGTRDDPLLIKTAEQLVDFARLVNNGTLPTTLPEQPHLKLVNDINLSAYGKDYDSGNGWTPIGGYNIDKKEFYSFNGTFDGNGKTIRGLYIHHDSRGYVGLFGYIKGGTVKNLTVEGGNVTGKASTGGIVGDLSEGQVENCVFSGSVTGEEGTGGIVGNLHASQLEDCLNNGSVSGNLATGGIVGGAGSDNEGDSIENCVNSGEITGSKELTGGIVGLLGDMIVNRCVNTGTVQGDTGMNIGGVAGVVSEGKIRSCVNTGGVSSNANNIGGVVGWVRAGTIQNCVNYADISSNANSVGGVAGFVEGGSTVTNCLTTGNISGKVEKIEPGGISGVAGKLHSKNNISGCVALGQSVTNNGEMGSVARIASIEPDDIAFDNFAWKGMKLWWYGEPIPEEDYSIGDGADAGATTLQTLWTNGALAESWRDAGVWTLTEGKLPVLTGLPHQSNTFPSYIPVATIDPASKTFPAATVGYGAQTEQQFTIENMGTATITGLSATLTGGTYFEISMGLSGTSIASESTATVGVRPKTELPVGTYADTLSITGEGGISLLVNLYFTVSKSSGGGSGGSGNSGGSSGSSNSSSNNSGATVNITVQNVTDAFDKALADAKKNGNEQSGIALVLRVDTGGKTISNVTINLPKTVQDIIISKKIVNIVVVVDDPDIRIGMDLATVREINKQANSDVNITATRVDGGKLTGDAKKAIGSRPVFDLRVNYGSGKQVQSFGTGSVSVTIPYTLGANEKAGNICAVYVDGNGKVHWLVSSVYDSVEKVLRFSTNHFSIYGIGYKQTNTAFTDIASHWAKEDIEFVVSRGLFSGTSTTTFSPNTAMTRGMFVTALGRLANADVSVYKQSSFSDVKNDAYYMGYIEWANKNSIVNGTGNGKFAPDQSITREQMAVIMQNYSRVNGFTMPKVHAENTFTDSAKISAYGKDAVKQMQMAGVISGKNRNLFDPQGTATRAEASAVLRRFVELAISSF